MAQRGEFWPQLVVFDWDGTLADSTAQIVASMKHAAHVMTLPELPDDVVKSIIGLGLPEAIAALYPELSESDIQRFRQLYAQHFIEQDPASISFYPHVPELLGELAEKQVVMAIATGKSRAGLERVLANNALRPFFAFTRCADESRSKPHPQMLQDILAKLAIRPEKALMVGDTSFDLEMAGRAGVSAVGVTYGAHPRERLQRHEPLGLIDCLSGLPEYLLRR